jgi:hypothetical protein
MTCLEDKNMKRIALFNCIGLFLQVWVLWAQTKQFTFLVPVELHAIPSDLTSFDVMIYIFDRVHEPGGYEGEMIGGGSTRNQVTNGEFVDTVTVEFNATTGHDPAKAVFWTALLIFRKGNFQDAINMEQDSPYPHNPEKPYIPILSGLIYPPSQPDQIPVKHIDPVKINRQEWRPIKKK